jgi:hypothetical protein
MRLLYLVFAIVTIGCNNSSSQDMDQEIIISNKLYGDWSLCKVISNDATTSYNICPKVRFYNDSTGNFIKPSKEEFSFKFNLQDKKLVIFFDDKNSRNIYFTDETEFYYEIKEEKKLLILELQPITKDYKYILSKSQ